MREPDGDDLGGVIKACGVFGRFQIANEGRRFSEVIEDALHTVGMSARGGSRLRIVPLPDLIALKIFPDGHKSKAIMIQSNLWNPDLDRDEVCFRCRKCRLRGLADLTRKAESG